MIIKYEDCSEIIESGYEVIVPLVISQIDGKTEIEAYSDIKDIVQTITERYPRALISKRAIDDIDLLLEPYVNSHGYFREVTGKYKWYEVYTLDDPSCVDSDLINDNTVKLCDMHLELENLTTFDLKELLDNKLDSFVVIQDSAIVAISSVNVHHEDQRLLEITVECAPSHRRRGYAASACSALCAFLLNRAYTVSYVTSRYNRSSIKLAKKLSFRKSGRFYAYYAFTDQ